MAEGWARHLKSAIIEPYSAGVKPETLDQRAVTVMAEAGIDISKQRSKPLSELAGMQFDYVVTVCDHARESCPVFAVETKTMHSGFDDPPALAMGAKTDEEALGHYRRVRDEIRTLVEKLPDLFEEL
jgi:arsenate reductase